MRHRLATTADLTLLARWNHELIEDERAPNPMSGAELERRMQGLITTGLYTASVFEIDGTPLAYALYRELVGEIFLRHFFVSRDHRRTGIGERALRALEHEVWADTDRIVLEVLVHNQRGLAFWRAMGFGELSLTMEKRN